MIDLSFLLLPLQEPYRLIQGSFIFAGLWVVMRLLKMCYFEIFYYEGAGEDYFRNGSLYVKCKRRNLKVFGNYFNSIGNKGNKK